MNPTRIERMTLRSGISRATWEIISNWIEDLERWKHTAAPQVLFGYIFIMGKEFILQLANPIELDQTFITLKGSWMTHC